MINNQTTHQQKVKIDGFIFHQELLDQLLFMHKEGTKSMNGQKGQRPTASALASLLVLMYENDRQNHPEGIVTDFSISKYARTVHPCYSSFRNGIEWLEAYNFITPTVLNGRPGWRIEAVAKAKKEAAQDKKLNYFRVPYTLFEPGVTVLSNFIRFANPGGIFLMLKLLNQFRNAVPYIDSDNDQELEGHLKEKTFKRDMKTLKRELGKQAKGVRATVDILQDIFNVDYIDKKTIGTKSIQMWVRGFDFSLKVECVKHNTDRLNVDQLVAALDQEVKHCLSTNHIKYRVNDVRGVMIAFKQEVLSDLSFVLDHTAENPIEERDRFIKELFSDALYSFEETVRKLHKQGKKLHIRIALGAYFRPIFRRIHKSAVERMDPSHHLDAISRKDDFLRKGVVF